MIIETFEEIALVNGNLRDKALNIVTLPPGVHEIQRTMSPWSSKDEWLVIKGTMTGNYPRFWTNLINEGTARIVSES
jgi:hypothetical protein